MKLEDSKSFVTIETAVPTDIPTAKSIQISRVHSPVSAVPTNYIYQLRKYFATPRVIREGHIFGIPVIKRIISIHSHYFLTFFFLASPFLPKIDFPDGESVDMETIYSSFININSTPSSDDPLQEFIFFRVTKVTTDDNALSHGAVWLNKDITSLTQEGKLNARVPPTRTIDSRPAGTQFVTQK